MYLASKFFRFAFGVSGNKTAVPDAIDPSGYVSYKEGFPADYELPKTNPSRKPVPRDKTNQIYYDLSSAIQQYQKYSVPEFITSTDNGGVAFSYSLGVRVMYTADAGATWNIYRSIAAANTALPTDATKWTIDNEPAAAPLPPRYIAGLEMSNGTDATNDINISTGSAKSSDDDQDITVATAIGKQIDQPWAAGGTTGAPTGGFPSGITLTNNTWYRMFLIAKTDGTVGAGFDTSSTAANLLADATGYTKYRHIGWIRRGTATNLAFFQNGSEFEFDTPIADYSAATMAATTELKTLTVPAGSEALFSANCRRGSSSGSSFWRFYQSAMTSAAASSANADLTSGVSVGGTWEYSASGRLSVVTDGSSQIKLSCNTTGADSSFYINTRGWIDPDLL